MKGLNIIIVLLVIATNLQGQVLTNIDETLIFEKIKKIPIGFENNYGLTNRQQIDSLVIGKIIKMYGISEISLTNEDDIKFYHELNNILIPIFFNDKIVFFVKGRIEKDNRIKLFGLGGNLYANSINYQVDLFKYAEYPALLQCSPLNLSFLFL